MFPASQERDGVPNVTDPSCGSKFPVRHGEALSSPKLSALIAEPCLVLLKLTALLQFNRPVMVLRHIVYMQRMAASLAIFWRLENACQTAGELMLIAVCGRCGRGCRLLLLVAPEFPFSGPP